MAHEDELREKREALRHEAERKQRAARLQTAQQQADTVGGGRRWRGFCILEQCCGRCRSFCLCVIIFPHLLGRPVGALSCWRSKENHAWQHKRHRVTNSPVGSPCIIARGVLAC